MGTSKLSPCAPNTQAPALSDFPAWMRILICPRGIFLFSWIPWSPHKL